MNNRGWWLPTDPQASGVSCACGNAVASAAADFSRWTQQEPDIATMVDDAVTSYVQTGTFYWQSDVAKNAIRDFTATYPNRRTTDDQCTSDLNNGVKLTWRMRSDSVLYRQCAYTNGLLIDKDFDTDGTGCKTRENDDWMECAYHDKRGVENNNRKRLICLVQHFCPSTASQCDYEHIDLRLDAVRCVTGLAYDGTPADILPSYTAREGVKFHWLDTSLTEAGFKLYRSDDPDLGDDLGELIADITTPSTGCGENYGPLQYTDKDTGDQPGQNVVYTVAALNKTGNFVGANFSRVNYTSPWVADLMVTVETEAGGTVNGVTVVVTHMFAADKKDPNFRLVDVTDSFGQVHFPIRVWDWIHWNKITQNFIVSAEYCEGGTFDVVDGERTCVNGIDHEFDESPDLVMRHLFDSDFKVIDKTAVTIAGYVFYGQGPDDGGGNFDEMFDYWWDKKPPTTCREENLRIERASCPYSFTEFGPDFDGDADKPWCFCPISISPSLEVSITITTDKTTKILTPDDTGYFSHSVSLGSDVKVAIEPSAGADWTIWEARNRSATMTLGSNFTAVVNTTRAGGGKGNSIKFVAHYRKINSRVRLAVAHGGRGHLHAVVAGPEITVNGVQRQQSMFPTGQRLLVEQPACGFSKEIVTALGKADLDGLPATSFQVTLPDETIELDRPVTCLRCEEAKANVDTVDATDRVACRVESITADSKNPRLGCADPVKLKFEHVDEYFTTAEQRTQVINFEEEEEEDDDRSSALSYDREVTYEYRSPLCFLKATVGPATKIRRASSGKDPSTIDDVEEPALHNLYDNDEPRTDWVGDEKEELFLYNADLTEHQTPSPNPYDPYGKICVDERSSVFVQGDVLSFKFTFGEVYPLPHADCVWPWDFDPGGPAEGCVTTFEIEEIDAVDPTTELWYSAEAKDDISVNIVDGFSGADTASEDYRKGRITCDGVACSFDMTTRVTELNPFVPFTLPFAVTFTRASDDSEITFQRRAIALGVLEDEVPELITYMTDESLVFAVLRDPPGSGSYASLDAGSSLTIGLSVEGMHASSLGMSHALTMEQNSGFKVKMDAAPMGSVPKSSWNLYPPRLNFYFLTVCVGVQS